MTESANIFGKDNYCEVMDHSLDSERNVRRITASPKLNFVATNDMHYTRQEDNGPRGAAAVPVRLDTTAPSATKFGAASTCARQKMYALFGDIPGTCENTLEYRTLQRRGSIPGRITAPNFPPCPGRNETLVREGPRRACLPLPAGAFPTCAQANRVQW